MIHKVLEFIMSPVKKSRNIYFYSQFVGQNKIFFDIGANVGFKTDVFRKIGVKVVAVEPQDGCFKILERKFGNDYNVIMVKKGMGKERGNLKIKISSSSSYISTFSDKWRKDGRFKEFVFDREQEVEMITFDDLIKEYGIPDFAKIDVEGYEYEVLSGLNTKIPCLSFEFTSEFISDSIKIIEHLNGLGFKEFNYGKGEKMSLCLEKWLNKGDFINLINDQTIKINDIWGDIYAR